MSRSRADARLDWTDWPTDRLLDLRFRDLGVRLEGTWLEDVVDRLHLDLERRGLRFRPHVWLGTEWFSPTGVPGIAIPFYLAHPRLVRLERSLMLEVEGGTQRECLKILRHECGHAIQVAHRLNRRRAWQRLFGRSSQRYPDAYRPDPSSRHYVQHLRMFYAQSHPDEDFAETFAVWLAPRSQWRQRYARWPAIKKLEYVDELMHEVGGEAAKVRSRRLVDPIHRLASTLRDHYQERLERYKPGVPDIFDEDLRRLFAEDGHLDRAERASQFLRRNRAEIRRLVSRWTGEYQFTLEQVLEDMIRRSRELGLWAVGEEDALRMDFAVLLTVHTMHVLHKHRHWISM